MVKRAEVWLVNGEKTGDASTEEQRWPGVVVSPHEMDAYLDTLIVAPMSTKEVPAPFRVPVLFMQKEGLILLDRICTVDKSRLVRKLGAIDEGTMTQTLDVLQEVFAY